MASEICHAGRNGRRTGDARCVVAVRRHRGVPRGTGGMRHDAALGDIRRAGYTRTHSAERVACGGARQPETSSKRESQMGCGESGINRSTEGVVRVRRLWYVDHTPARKRKREGENDNVTQGKELYTHVVFFYQAGRTERSLYLQLIPSLSGQRTTCTTQTHCHVQVV